MNSNARLAFRAYQTSKSGAMKTSAPPPPIRPPQPIQGQQFPNTAMPAPAQPGAQSPQPAGTGDPVTDAAAQAQVQQQMEQAGQQTQQLQEQAAQLQHENATLQLKAQQLEAEKSIEKQKAQLAAAGAKASAPGKTPEAPKPSYEILKGMSKRMTSAVAKTANTRLLVLTGGLVKSAVDQVLPQVDPGQHPPIASAWKPQGAVANSGESVSALRNSGVDNFIRNLNTDEVRQPAPPLKDPNAFQESWSRVGVQPGGKSILGRFGAIPDAWRNWWNSSDIIGGTEAKMKNFANRAVGENIVQPGLDATSHAMAARDAAEAYGGNLYNLYHNIGHSPRSWLDENKWTEDIGAPLGGAISNLGGWMNHTARGVGNAALSLASLTPLGFAGSVGVRKATDAMGGEPFQGVQLNYPGREEEQRATTAKQLQSWTPEGSGGAGTTPSNPIGERSPWDQAQVLNNMGYFGYDRLPSSSYYKDRTTYDDPRMKALMQGFLPMAGMGMKALGLRNIVDPEPDYSMFKDTTHEQAGIDPRIAAMLPLWNRMNYGTM